MARARAKGCGSQGEDLNMRWIRYRYRLVDIGRGIFMICYVQYTVKDSGRYFFVVTIWRP